MDFSTVLDNQLVGGGLVLGVVGFAIAWLKSLPAILWTRFLKHFTVTVEVTSQDAVFRWVSAWLEQHLKSFRHAIATVDTRGEDDNFMLSPCKGMHWGWFGWIPMCVVRTRKDDNKSHGDVFESYHLTFFTRNRNVISDVISRASEIFSPKDNKITFWIGDPPGWTWLARMKPRSLKSVILPDNSLETIVEDMRQFRSSDEWYRETGIPYRRGYLFYGPPGNGKTSAIAAAAGALGLSVYILSLQSPEIDDDRLIKMLHAVMDDSIVLIEDVDAAFIKREKTDKDRGGITFSGLLNALDGVASKRGRILCMTTNHIDRLDPALIREGRIDMKMEIKNASPKQAGEIFRRFYGPQYSMLPQEFASHIEDDKHSMASIQEHLLRHRDDPQKCVAMAGRFRSNQ